MGFSLGGFMSGAATAVDTKMKNDRIDREAERSKVENVIYNTSGKLFANASLIEETRASERKKNNKYMTELLSSAGKSLRNDTAKQAYILSLDDGAREDLLTLSLRVQDPTFNPEGRSFADYLTAAEDPIEYKDATTLNEKVMGAVTPRPMDNSAYYGVSDTKDAEVDKIVASYNSVFAATYNMNADKARGLLDAAKQEVKVQSFNIDWAHKKDLLAKDAARLTALVATAQLGTLEAEQNVKRSMETRATAFFKKTRQEHIAGSGALNEEFFNKDPNNQAAYLASAEYKATVKSIISESVLYMESHPILKEITMSFLRQNFPGQYGGEVGEENPVADLKPDTYYLGNFRDGLGIATGAQIQAAKGITGGKGKAAVTSAGVDTYAGSPAAVTEGDPFGYTTPPTPEQPSAVATAMSTLQASHAELLEKRNSPTAIGGRKTGGNIKEIEANMAALKADPTSLESVNILAGVALDSGSNTFIEQAIEIIEDYTEEHKSEIKRGSSMPRLNNLTSRLRNALVENEAGPTPIRELTPYQQVMIDEKRGTIGAAKAYDQAVDIAVQSGDMAAVRNIQSIISGLMGGQTGVGVSDMLDEITAKIESALNK